MSTAPAPIGSAWDVATAGPDAPLTRHLAEWVRQSACHPALAAANVQTMAGTEVLEALAGDRLEQLGGHAQQFATGSVARLLRPLEPIAEAGGWWCSSLDPLADWAPMAWGCFKPDQPRWDQERHRPRKYEHPIKAAARSFWLRVPAAVAQLAADRFGLVLPLEVAADQSGNAGAFWRWWARERCLPLVLTEGSKKAAALLSIGLPAVALPGIWNGAPKNPTTDRPELLADLAALPLEVRPVWVLFDCPKASNTDPDELKAARRLGRLLAAAGARVLVGTVPGTHGKGADDHLSNGGSWEQLAGALKPLGPLPVLPRLQRADRIASAGQWLGVACPIPSPEVAPLVVLAAPMGCGKTRAIADALAPLQAAGVPVLMPTHRKAVGRGSAAAVGVPWRAAPGSDERLQGMAACLDSWCPESSLAITGHSASGAVMVADEWMQQLEHLLLSTGTTLAKEPGRRASVLRTLAEQLARLRQGLFPDAQMADWGVQLLERLTGRRALLIASEHRPMLGRPLHCPQGLKTAEAAGDAFRAKWAQLLARDWESLFCWVSAQRGDVLNSPQRLAALHLERHPLDLVDVIDATTTELAAELANDPNGFIAGRLEQAQQQGARYALYASPAISSGTSFEHWRPDAVIAYAGGCIAPEHVAQALARVRCPEVPAWLFAPERATGAALKVGSGATNPAQLIADLRAVSDPLYGELEQGGADGAWLQAWGELGAFRNRQQHAFRASIAGLLVELEGWELQAPEAEPCPAAGAQVKADLKAAAEAFRLAALEAITEAPLLSPQAAAELRRRRRLEPNDRAALDRFQVASRWGLGDAPPSLELLEADRDKLRDRLKLGWLLTTPDAAALVPEHDWQQIEALDPHGRPFAPDRLRVTLGSKLGAFACIGTDQRPRVLLELLERFGSGEVIAADDPAIEALHRCIAGPDEKAARYRRQLAAAAGISPGAKPSGTLRALLQAIGWQLERVGRRHGGGALTYRAAPMPLPQGVEAQALQSVWRSELQAAPQGALLAPMGSIRRGEKCSAPPTAPPPGPPPAGQRRPMAGFRALLRALAPPPPRPLAFVAA